MPDRRRVISANPKSQNPNSNGHEPRGTKTHLGFGIWDFLLSQARDKLTDLGGPGMDELLDRRVRSFELRQRVG